MDLDWVGALVGPFGNTVDLIEYNSRISRRTEKCRLVDSELGGLKIHQWVGAHRDAS